MAAIPEGLPFVAGDIVEFADSPALTELLFEYAGYLVHQTAQLRRAVSEGRRGEAHRIAHAIRGGALTIRAWDLADAAHNLENVSNTTPLPADDALMSELESKVVAWLTALREAKTVLTG